MQPQANHSRSFGRMVSSSLSGVAIAAPKISTPTKVSVTPSISGNMPGPIWVKVPSVIGHGIERDRRAEQGHQSAGVEVPLFHQSAEQERVLQAFFLADCFKTRGGFPYL